MIKQGPSAAASILSETAQRLNTSKAVLVYVTKDGQMHFVTHEAKEKPMAKAKPKKKPKPRY